MRIVFVSLLALAVFLGGVATALAQQATQTIALETSLTGPGAFQGIPALEGARLAVAEADQDPSQPPVAIAVKDDQSSPKQAAALARDIAASDAVAVIGPILTVSATETGPVYAQAGLASIDPTATGDAVPDAATTYQAIFNTSEVGTTLANYLFYVLHGQCAEILYRNDVHGQPIAAGFTQTASQLKIAANFYPYTDDAGRAKAVSVAAQIAATNACHPAIVLGMLANDALPVIEALRRGGFTGPILAPDTIADDNFAKLFAGTKEEQASPGFFTNNLYAAAPIIFDSADTATLAFAQLFRTRFGHAPAWAAMQTYDATMLAISAARQAEQSAGATASPALRRKAVLDYLASLNSPGNAYPGVADPIWFTASRGREQPLRMGSFQGQLFVSAPLQLVPVAQPDPGEIKSGELRDIGDGYARIQQVVYTGIYLNEVPRLDIATASFTADFYLWLRYTPAQDIGDQDPSRIDFPDLATGTFDPRQPVLERSLPDGSVYKLWHVRGSFKNDFDLHRYPFDHQRLVVRLFNATADSSRIVYVLDRQSFPEMSGTRSTPADTGGDAEAAEPGAVSFFPLPSEFLLEAAPDAFRDLTQWNAKSVQQVRDNLVTLSALGDPVLVGLERERELSGFELSVDVQRRLYTTLSKSLLPLGLITLIMFSSLYFPPQLVKEKVTVAVTAALSGVVLQTSLNTQLGAVGYNMEIDYVFYVYFALSLLCIVSVLIAERYRSTGSGKAAIRTEVASRLLFAFLVAVTVIALFASQN
jgi:ABC-type branched-subunit amino acid transport system substrate-binding protein